jgi:imidazole glycerol-phosphate synthase subunit HisH
MMSQKKVSIVKSSYANLYSVQNALLAIGAEANVTSNKQELLDSEMLICPGVGSFEQVKNHFDANGLTDTITEFIQSGKAFLGICVGMQMLFDLSHEGSQTSKGLGIFSGDVQLLPSSVQRIPHIGWNNLIVNNNHVYELLTQGGNAQPKASSEQEVYFVHSYYCSAKEQNDVIAFTEPAVGFKIPAIVNQNNVYGMQFHPERSGTLGLKMLENFLQLAH